MPGFMLVSLRALRFVAFSVRFISAVLLFCSLLGVISGPARAADPAFSNATAPVDTQPASESTASPVSQAPSGPAVSPAAEPSSTTVNATVRPAAATPASSEGASAPANGQGVSAPLPLPEIAWFASRPGLELGLTTLPESIATGSEARFVVVRIDPARFDFSLHMASEEGAAHSLREWSEKFKLCAGINSSMYLPDNVTSTGLMRSAEHVNNAKIGGKLGAFFVAGPKEKGLPRADILEHDTEGWRGLVECYTLAVQNYRLIAGSGRVLWAAGGPAHSIAVAAKDKAGRILFILSQEPLTAAAFAGYLQRSSLGVTTVMYVEGGAQAGIFLQETDGPGMNARAGAASYVGHGGTLHVWKGRQSLLNTRGNPDAPLPNILGIAPRSAQP